MCEYGNVRKSLEEDKKNLKEKYLIKLYLV